jgi:hypothetical protein
VFVNPPLLLSNNCSSCAITWSSELSAGTEFQVLGIGNRGRANTIAGFTFAPASFKNLIGKELAVVSGIQNFTMPNDSETNDEDYLPYGESETDEEDELLDEEDELLDDDQSLSELDPLTSALSGLEQESNDGPSNLANV